MTLRAAHGLGGGRVLEGGVAADGVLEEVPAAVLGGNLRNELRSSGMRKYNDSEAALLCRFLQQNSLCELMKINVFA